MKTLADSGHNVTMICPFTEVEPSNNMKIVDHRINSTSELKSRFSNSDFLKTSVLKHWQNAKKHLTQDCEDFINSPKIQVSHRQRKSRLSDCFLISPSVSFFSMKYFPYCLVIEC